jgi:CIC family chloride channel protein
MSNDYRLILPLMMASVVATLAAELMFNESIYTLKLKQKGISVRRGRVVDVLQSVRVDEVLSKPKPLAHNATLEQAEREFARQGRRTLPVVDGRARLAGVFSLADLELAVQQDLPWKTPVRQLATPLAGISLAYADEPVGEALRRMSSRGLSMLPVVSRRRPGKLEGVVRRDDILSAYDLALARRTEVEHRAEQLRARNEEHTTFVEFQLSARGWAVGKTIADVAKRLPAGCVVVSIRRKGEVLIPRGATRFQRADQVMVYARKEDLEAVRATLG